MEELLDDMSSKNWGWLYTPLYIFLYCIISWLDSNLLNNVNLENVAWGKICVS